MKIQELFEQKGTKAEAGYQDSPKNGQKCVNCTMWRDPNKCTAVEGKIDPNGWCKWYAGGAYGKRGKQIKEDGRIVKGVNTTVDVGVDQTKIEAAKFGNRVTRNGFPPTLNSNGKINESLTAYQQAIVEGGHTLEDPRFSFLREIQEVELDEGIKDTLRKLAIIGSLGATVAGGIATKKAYDDLYKEKPPEVTQTVNKQPAKTELPTRPISKTPAPTKDTEVTTAKSDLAPTTSIRPQPRPDQDEDIPRPKARPNLKTLGPYSSYLYDEATRQGIKGVELIALMAQAAQETGQFKDLDENGDSEYFQMYDPEHSPEKAADLGNDQPGDGEKYKGRGFLHITGKYNYAEVGKAFGMPFVEEPELLEDPEIAAKTSVWFWLNKVRPHVKNFNNVRSVTRKINPKLHALSKREQFFHDYVDLVSKFSEK